MSMSMAWEGGWAPPESAASIFDETVHPLLAADEQLSAEARAAAAAAATLVPSVCEVCAFVEHLAISARRGPEASVVGLAYVERLLGSDSGVVLGATTWRRVVLTAWLLAAKMWDDECFEIPDFALLFGVDAEDVVRLEAAFVPALRFNLSVAPADYARYYFGLRSICQLSADDFPLRRLDDALAMRLQRHLASPVAVDACGPCADSEPVEPLVDVLSLRCSI
jgi:hypothetical protein